MERAGRKIDKVYSFPDWFKLEAGFRYRDADGDICVIVSKDGTIQTSKPLGYITINTKATGSQSHTLCENGHDRGIIVAVTRSDPKDNIFLKRLTVEDVLEAEPV